MNHPPSVRREYLVLIALWLMVLASSSQVMIIAPILPTLGEELSIAPALRGTLVTGFALALSLFAIIIGPISDRVGRRPILLLGTGSMTAMLLLHPLAFDYASILTVRIATGAAAGMLTGSAVSYVGDYFPYERRGWANGWVMSGVAVGQIIGVPAGTILADRFGFHAPFVVFAGAMAGSFVLILAVVPQPNIVRDDTRLSLRSAMNGYASLLRRPQIRGAALAYATMFFSISCFVIYFPTWAGQRLGMGANSIALLFVVGGTVNVVVGPRAGKLSDRFGRKPLIITSCLGTAVIFATTTLLVRAPWAAYVLFFVIMILVAIRIAPFQALLTALVEDRQRGSLMSLVVAVGQVGGGAGAALSGYLYAETGYMGCTILSAIAVFATGLLVALRLPEPSIAPVPAR